MNKSLMVTLFLFGFLLISGCVQNKPGVNIKKCNTDSDCVFFIEGEGDPAGQIHCSNIIYEETCGSCSRITDTIPRNRSCSCEKTNALGDKYCIYRMNGEKVR